MNLYSFESKPKISPFAPEWRFYMGEEQLEGIDWHHIAQLILSKEKQIIASTPMGNDGYTGLGENSLTSRYKYFNVFAWPDRELENLKVLIKNAHDAFLNIFGIPIAPVWIQCWANVMRSGEKINTHVHTVEPDCYLGGHVTIQCENTSTVYVNPINVLNDPMEYRSINVPGKLTLFQNCIPHYTTTHQGHQERISIAFDLSIDDYGDPNRILL